MTVCPRCGQTEPPTEKYDEGFPEAAKQLVASVESAHRVAAARAEAGFPATQQMIARQSAAFAPSGLPAPGAVLSSEPAAPPDEAERFGWMVRTGMEMNGWSLAEAVEFVQWTLSVEVDGL